MREEVRETSAELVDRHRYWCQILNRDTWSRQDRFLLLVCAIGAPPVYCTLQNRRRHTVTSRFDAIQQGPFCSLRQPLPSVAQMPQSFSALINPEQSWLGALLSVHFMDRSSGIFLGRICPFGTTTRIGAVTIDGWLKDDVRFVVGGQVPFVTSVLSIAVVGDQIVAKAYIGLKSAFGGVLQGLILRERFSLLSSVLVMIAKASVALASTGSIALVSSATLARQLRENASVALESALVSFIHRMNMPKGAGVASVRFYVEATAFVQGFGGLFFGGFLRGVLCQASSRGTKTDRTLL